MLIDTHAHLDFPEFAPDLPEILGRARAAGVERIITIGTSINGSRRAIQLAEEHDMVRAVVGIHPNSAHEAPADAMDLLREMARHPRVVALGETGLDYHYLPGRELKAQAVHVEALGDEMTSDVQAAILDGAMKSRQAELFQAHLELAVETGLNVVIHQRDAWEETLDILRPFTGRLRAVFHCFGNTLDEARQLAELGHLVSFTGIVSFKNAQQIRATAAAVPEFMVETDCPYLAPVPHRGKRCEPAHVRIVAETIAALRAETLERVSATTEATARRFFRGL